MEAKEKTKYLLLLETQRLKQELEVKIKNLINEFKEDTTLDVNAIDLTIAQNGRGEKLVISVKAEVKL